MADAAEPGDGAARSAVFISYSRKDQAFADELAGALDAAGFDVLIDRSDIAPSEDWRARLDGLILSADAVVFVISPDAVASEVCAWEVERTKALGKRLAPLLLRPPGDSALPAELARLNWIDCGPEAPRDAAFAKLREALVTDIDWVREHTRVVQLAARWDKSDRPDSQVLRGEEITAVQGWMSRRAEGAPSLPNALLAFVDASVAAEQAAREKERAQLMRIRRGQRVVAIALSVVFLLLLAGAWSALDLNWRTKDQVSRLLSNAAHQSADAGEDGRAVRLALLAAREALQTPRRTALNEAEPALARASRESRLVAEAHVEGPIINAALTPDGSVFATAGVDGAARLWNARTGEAVGAPLRHGDGNVYSVSFSGDGRLLASGGDDRMARLWDAHTGVSAGAPLQHESEVVRVALNATGDGLATQTLNGHARIWRRAGNSFAAQAVGGEFMSLAVSADGGCFAFGGRNGPTRVMCGARDMAFATPGEMAAFLAFSEDATVLATVNELGRGRFWDVSSGRQRGATFEHGGPIVALAFAPDGQTLATAGEDGVVRFWSVETSAPAAAPLRLPGRGSGVVFSPDGQHLIAMSFGAGSAGGEATLWARNGAEWRRAGRPLRHEGAIMTAAFAADGASLLTAALDATARVWDIGADIAAPVSFRHGSDYVVVLAFSPDGATLASGGDDGALKLWDIASHREIELRMQHEGPIYDMAFAPDGRHVATAGLDNVRMWDVATGELAFAPITPPAPALAVAFSPDGAELMTGDDSGAVILWDARTGEMKRQLLDLDNSVFSVAFSPDATRFATSGWELDGQVWRLDNSQPVGAPLNHNIASSKIVFSPDGSLVATAGLDRRAQVWRADTGAAAGPEMRQRDGIHWIVFSPDGSRLATASEDGVVQLWDARTGGPAAAPLQIDTFLRVAVFSPDGRTIAAAGADGLVRMWSVDGLMRRPTLQALMRETCERRLDDGARRVSPGDTAFAPIIAGRENEDVCRPPSLVERASRGLAALLRR
ncbi:MAG: TIR domain-containing protein [Hyphomonadaceae bacterium]